LVSFLDAVHNFTWQKYLSETVSRAAPEILFCTRKPFKFQPGMKLEVVDRKNPALIRPATILETNGYELKVLFDGWPSIYAFWMEDDSVDIHPVNWSLKTNHLIEFPPGEK
jgi:lethal(3)malignant brain tumor-like protein